MDRAKYPAALTEHFDKDNQPYFSIRFYYSENKPSYAAVVEKKMQLDAPNWMTVWRSDLDPNFESDLILQQPSGDLGGWAEIRRSEPMGNSDFVRIRYEKLPAE